MERTVNDSIAAVREKLENSEEIDLLEFSLFSPLEEDKQLALIQESGKVFPQLLRSLYATTNGWRVCWLDRSNEQYAALKTLWESVGDDWWRWQNDYYPFDGIIQILPLAELLQTSGENWWWFPGEPAFSVQMGEIESDSLSVKQNLQLFDVFHKFYANGLYWPGHGIEPLVLLGQDHEADFFSTKPLSVSDYLNFLLDSLGSLSAREELISKLST